MEADWNTARLSVSNLFCTMASPGFTATGGAKTHDQPSSPFRKFDIDTGTELWRKKLEARANATSQARRPRDVEGGIPPHLLQKSNTNSQLTNILNEQTPRAKSDIEGGLPPHLLFKQTSNPFPVAKNLNAPRPDQNTPSQPKSLTPQPQVNCGTPSQPLQSQIGALQVSTPAWQSQQCEAPVVLSKAPIVRPLNLRGPVPQQQQFPPTPKYEENATQSYMTGHTQENRGYQQQSKMGRQPVEIVSPVPGLVSGTRRKFQAKKSCDRESQSLPETVSSIKSNDDEHVKIHEVKNSLEHLESIHFSDDPDRSVDEDSIEDKQDKAKENTHNRVGSDSCEVWVRSVAKEPSAKCYFLEKQIDRHHECDVDPVSGVLLAPIEYPETHINPKDMSSGQESIRRLNGTAGLKSFADFSRNKRRFQNGQRSQEQTGRGGGERPWPSIQSPVPEATLTQGRPGSGGSKQHQNDEDRAPGTPGHLSGHGPAQVKATYGDPGLQGSYFLRPAEEGDVSQILEIYNWEVKNGFQALDTLPLVLKNMQSIFLQCRTDQIPFVVAVAGTPAEAAARKEEPARPRPYQAQRTGPYNQKLHHECHIPELDNILGFGFLSIPATGLAGSVQHSVCRFQARAHFYVDAKNRRKGIGRALLHKLTRCCSIYSINMGAYEWFDPSNSRVCDLPSFNSRNYSRLFVETASRSENDPDTLWSSKFLDSEGFVCVLTLDKARKIGNGEDSQWVDNLVWQLDCQNPNFITENHQNPYKL